MRCSAQRLLRQPGGDMAADGGQADNLDSIGYRHPDVCFSSKPICYNSRFPSVSVSDDGKLAVVVCHGAFRAYSMYYSIGRFLSDGAYWSKPKYIPLPPSNKWPTYYYPKVAQVSSKGKVIIAYGKVSSTKPQQRCFYRCGRIVDENTIVWGDETNVGDGTNVAIATHEYQSKVCLMFGRIVGLRGEVCVQGVVLDNDLNLVSESGVQTTCNLHRVKRISIAMNHGGVVIIASLNLRGTKIRTTIGHIQNNGQIEVRSKTKRKCEAKNLSISMNEGGVIVLMYETRVNRTLKYDLGLFNENNFNVQWSYLETGQIPSLCYGCYPSVSLLNNNSFIEVHSAQLHPRLLYSVRKINYRRQSLAGVQHTADEPQIQVMNDHDVPGGQISQNDRDNVMNPPGGTSRPCRQTEHDGQMPPSDDDGQHGNESKHRDGECRDCEYNCQNRKKGVRLVVTGSPTEEEKRTTVEELSIQLLDMLIQHTYCMMVLAVLLSAIILIIGVSLVLVLNSFTLISYTIIIIVILILLVMMMSITYLLWTLGWSPWERYAFWWSSECLHRRSDERKGGNKLLVHNLTELQDLIWNARPKFFHIGLQLGLDADALKSIEVSKNNRVEDCFSEVLTACINKGITWEQVVKALESPTVGYEMLAEEVRNHILRLYS